MNNKQRLQRRRLIATFMVIAYMVPDLLPGFISMAAPQVFVHPGAGVSRLPLQVSQFNAAGFGDLNDAVNLANGSVYVGTDSVSYNSKLASGDESTNTVGGSGWNLTQRMRLNGFNKASNANFGLDNLAVDPNPGSSYYDPYFLKPNVLPVNRLLSKDSPGQAGTCGNNYTSGVFRSEATPSALNNLPVGKYRLSFDGRADGSLSILYGLDDAVAGHFTGGTLTTSWQAITGDYTIAASDGLRSWLFEIYESTQNNPAWEVANVKLFALNASNVPVGANLIASQDFASSYYQPVCAKPQIETFYRMPSTDGTGTYAAYSGIARPELTPITLGRYRVSFDGRTRNGTLGITYGTSDYSVSTATLNTNWQSLNTEFNVTANPQNRIFEVFENTLNNPDWELKNIKVQRIAPSSFTLSQGDGSAVSFTQQTVTTPAQLAALNPPSWISRYSGTIADTAFYTLNPANGKQYSKEWIVLRRVGTNNMIAHYYDASGNRVTFHNDGEYADYTQNPSQQYRGANTPINDPEGETSSAPKTELKYWDYNATTGLSSGGLLNQTKDEYGRINVYGWNATDKTLSAVYQMVQDEANPTTSWQRLTQFYYCTTTLLNICPNTPQKLLTGRVDSAYDGKTANTVITRATNFTYQQPTSSDPVLLRSVSRQILNGSNWKTTFYTYNTAYQVSEVKTVVGTNYTDPASEPATTYTYGTGSTVTLMNPSLPILKLEPTQQSTVELEPPSITIGSSALGAIKNLGHNAFKTNSNATPSTSSNANVNNTHSSFVKPIDASFLKTRVATYRVPAGFASDLYRVQVEVQNKKHQSTLLSLKTNGVLYQSGVTLEGSQQRTLKLGELNLKSGQLLEVRANAGTAKFNKLTLVPIMVAAGPAQTFVKVTQGVQSGAGIPSTDANRKSSAYYFDSNGQLVRKEVRDYNAYYTDYNVAGNPWSGPLDRNLIWYYDYNTNGSTSSVTSPSGRKDTMVYDANGNLTQSNTFLASTDATPLRSQTFTYDADNRMTNSSTPALSGTGYNYSVVDKPIIYTMSAAVTPPGSGQSFQYLMSAITQTNIAGVAQNSTTATFDTSGRVTQTKRSATGSSDQITNYVYHTGTTYGLWYPSWAQGAAVSTNDLIKQYGDQPVTITKVGFSTGTNFYYNAFGQVILSNDVTALKSDIDNNTAQTPITSSLKDRVMMAGFNGFGQKVFERLYEYGRVASEKNYNYYATGEIDASWDGYSTNVTDYRYQTTGADGGRLLGVIKGIGDGYAGSVTTQHESTIFAYDTFGRVSSKTIDGVNATSYVYDTLDRPIITTMQDGNRTVNTYSKAGPATTECNGGGAGNTAAGTIFVDNTRCNYKTVDALGRVLTLMDATNVPTSNTNYVITNTYDPYDRVLTQQNGSLFTIGSSAVDQTSYFAYNSLGKLTRQIGPVMRTVAGGLTDARRSSSEFMYDNLGRKTVTWTRISGDTNLPTVLANPNSSFLGSGTAKYAKTDYDTWDRVYQTTDSDFYYNYYAYDGVGNLTSKSQSYCGGGYATDTSCYDSVKKDDNTNPINSELVQYYTYDAAGRVTKTQDYRGNTTRVRYNAMGQVAAESDARGITTKGYVYTGDGLLDSIYEPDNDPTTTNTTFIDSGIFTGYAITKSFSYANTTRKYPTSTCTYGLNTNTPSAGAACTSYLYDWAGRPTTITLPDTSLAANSTVVQTFDARGNVTSLKDAEGFVTNYEFDAWNKMRKETKLARAGNGIDIASFGAGYAGLVSTYNYDLAGNLLQKRERGLVTTYAYNSLGKATYESRPYVPSDGLWAVPAGGTQYKYRTYRLDGELLAENSYDAPGTAFINLANFDDAAAIPAAPATGNITGYKLTPLGRRYKEYSVGNGITEYTANIYYNGLGLKTKREFTGNSGIYAYINTPSKSYLPPSYNTLWTYDSNGNLLTATNVLPDGTYNWDSFTYKYSKTNKEVARVGNVFVYAPSKRLANTTRLIGKTSSSGLTAIPSAAPVIVHNDPPGSPPIVRPLSLTTFDYNERDLYKAIQVEDTDLREVTVNRTTSYDYYLDGSKSKTTVTQEIPDPNAPPLQRPIPMVTQGLGTQTYSYDSRGRMISNVDSNGSGGGALTNTTTYDNTGVVTESVSDNSFSQIRTPTVGGMIAKTVTHAISDRNNCKVAVCDETVVNTYNANGFLATSVSGANTTTFGYDNYGNQITQMFTDTVDTFQSYSATFNNINAMTSKSLYNQGTVTFGLSSKGWRLSTPTTNGNFTQPFENMDTQRYDAEGRTIRVERTNYSAHAFFPSIYPQNWTTTAFDVRYDPKGNQVLSVLSYILEEQDQDVNGLVNPSLVNVRTNSTVMVDDNVLFMHALHSNVGYQILSNGVNFWHQAVNVLTTQNQDETFSLADGSLTSPDEFNVTKPIGTYGVQPGNGTTALQAPVTPTSTNLGVTSASAVTPPTSSATPPTTPPASPVTPPTSSASTNATTPASSTSATPASSTPTSSATAPASSSSTSSTPASTTPSSSTAITNAATTPSSVSTPAFGVTTTNLTSTPEPSTSSSTTQTPTPATAGFSSNTALAAPVSITPPAISSISTASSITAPNSSIPGSIPNASGVTPPNSSVPASSTPSSSGVTPPSGSSPGTASGVTPPSGGGTVTPQDYLNPGPIGGCVKSNYGTDYGSGCDPKDLEQKAKELKDKIDKSTGLQEQTDLNYELALTNARLSDLKNYGALRKSAFDEVKSIHDDKSFQKKSPGQQLEVYKLINMALSGKQKGYAYIKDLHNAISNKNQSNTPYTPSYPVSLSPPQPSDEPLSLPTQLPNDFSSATSLSNTINLLAPGFPNSVPFPAFLPSGGTLSDASNYVIFGSTTLLGLSANIVEIPRLSAGVGLGFGLFGLGIGTILVFADSGLNLTQKIVITGVNTVFTGISIGFGYASAASAAVPPLAGFFIGLSFVFGGIGFIASNLLTSSYYTYNQQNKYLLDPNCLKFGFSRPCR